jgi:hypothetical protein
MPEIVERRAVRYARSGDRWSPQLREIAAADQAARVRPEHPLIVPE